MKPTPNVTLRMEIARTGLTQRVIAQRARIHEARFSGIARGHLNPSEKEQARIAKALGLAIDYLFPSTEVTS